MCSRSLVLLLCLLNGAASAATYRARAQLTIAPADRQHCLKIADQQVMDCSVVDQTRAAFSARVATMFTPTATANLELVLTVRDAYIVEQISGWVRSLELRTTTRVLTAQGALIDEIDSRGSATMTEDTSLAGAEQAAAAAAAAEFEERLYGSRKIRDYFIASQIARPAELMPPRSDRFFRMEVGSGLVQGGGDGDGGFALNARASMSVGWLMLQAGYSQLYSSFQGTTGGHYFDSDLITKAAGLDAGVVIRLGPRMEMRAGPGVQWLFASGDGSSWDIGNVSSSATRVTPTAFASLSGAFFPHRNGTRLVVSLEGRGYLATRVDLRNFNRGVPVANTMVGLFLGGEFPWGGTSR